ncbi:CPBP family intramembrane glutamic endopeptidase [Segetibacter koreensis]|uniref:CPBP family intramembrane glutamic endopeptidase n=1 Tax=Segetibacter koreensis TaxID=398037 RepID=UPI00037771DB|nr:CPBP family intramembrane glutamic endopeptidase [Segetibacter koreensis]
MRLSKQLVIFFLLTFVIAWITWFPSFLRPESFRLLPFVGLFAPALSALIVAFYFDRANGVRELLGRYKRLRFGVLWYIVAILLIPFLFVLSGWLDGLFSKTSIKSILLPTSPYFTLAALIWLMFINSGEEIGWRGFALPRLQSLFKNPLLATLLLGILWSAWHLPIYLTPGQSSFPLALFFFFTVGLSFIYTVVFNKTGESLFSAVLLHASTDIVPRVLNITLFKPTTWLILGILTWASAVILNIIKIKHRH